VPFFEASPAWTVNLPRSSELSLNLTVNAGQGHVNLGGMKLAVVDMTLNAGSAKLDFGEATSVASLDVTVNAGSATINLPATGTAGSFTVNAGSVAFCVPSGANLRIQSNDQLTASSNYSAQGLTRAGDAWTSAGFDPAATNRIELTTTANAGSLTLNPKEGCNG
jgi:archaellin